MKPKLPIILALIIVLFTMVACSSAAPEPSAAPKKIEPTKKSLSATPKKVSPTPTKKKEITKSGFETPQKTLKSTTMGLVLKTPAKGFMVEQSLQIPEIYVLQRGEYPYCIARRFNIDINVLLGINGLVANQYFYPGLPLKIPKGAPPWNGVRSIRSIPQSYTVRPGDTIYGIACAYGDVDPDALAAMNQISPPYTLTPGQVIVFSPAAPLSNPTVTKTLSSVPAKTKTPFALNEGESEPTFEMNYGQEPPNEGTMPPESVTQEPTPEHRTE